MGLLKGIDPLLSADLLWVLRAMGHGDRLVICDCNFPAFEVSKKTTSGKLVVMEGCDLIVALKATLSVLPLDYFAVDPVVHMSPSENLTIPSEGQQALDEARSVVEARAPGVGFSPLERFRFYEEARQTFAVVQTMERRPYCNVILTKGVVGPDGKDLKPS